MPDVTVGLVPRDRFCRSEECLARLLDCTDIPFNLIVVNCSIPERYWRPIGNLLKRRSNVKVLETPAISSNQARNLVLQESPSEFLCLIENDVYVHPNWLTALVDACEEHPAEVAAPLLLEPHLSSDRVHFDPRLGHIRIVRRDGLQRLKIVAGGSPAESDRNGERRITEFVEMHCVMFRRRVFERIGFFDEKISGSRAEVDLSLALYTAGIPVVLEPRSRVTFMQPPPVHPDEKEYYLRYWNLDQAIRDHERIRSKWNLTACPTAVEFVKARIRIPQEPDPRKQILLDEQRMQREDDYAEQVRAALLEISAVIPANETIILVDQAIWTFYGIDRVFNVLPFTERDGDYWGPPEDDDAAIRECERLRSQGATFIAFGWPAFWWLEHYAAFREYLRRSYRCVLESSQVVVFDLNSDVRAE